ncbi:MAG TPA: Gfo/Idh/MocA family oxidoreductase [Tepidisphaeraceae bacterium]|nr:Gfo/Idh/MocA family oxidoreductase [Tepidisphaeraceae bacterium]
MSEAQSSKVIRFGIVGCGSIAATHAGAIRQLGHRVVAVADPLQPRADALAKRFDVSAVHPDHASLAADPAVEVACICTPSGMHAEHAIACLAHHKHVLVEKPMDVSLAECDRLIAAARQSRGKLGIISQHRFDAGTQLARRMIDAGELGRIVLATGECKWYRSQSYYDEGEWRGTARLDGGALMNQGIHTVDLLQWLAGGVAEVSAQLQTAAHERIDVEDVAVLSLRFRNGAIGSMLATTAAFDGLPARIEIHGTLGSILLEGDNIRRIALKDGRTFESHAAAAHAVSVARGGTASVQNDAIDRLPSAPDGAKWGDAHRAQIEEFVQAIQSQKAPAIDGLAAREPVAIVAAAYASARANGAWVRT